MSLIKIINNATDIKYFYDEKLNFFSRNINENTEKFLSYNTKPNSIFYCSYHLIKEHISISSGSEKAENTFNITINCPIRYYPFSISFKWFSLSHSISDIGDFGLFDYYSINNDETALDTYNVKYNEIIDFINKICRPLPRDKSLIYHQFENIKKFPRDLILLAMDYTYDHISKN